MMLLFVLLMIVQVFEVPATSINPLHQGNLSDHSQKNRLLQRLNGRSVVRDWNAIIAIKGERVNQMWKKQYDDRTKNGYTKRFTSERSISHETRTFKIESRVMLEFGPPLIQLMPYKQDWASLKMKIKSAKVEYWETMKRSGNKVDNYIENLPLRDDTSVSSIIYLPKISGALTKDSRVVLDLSSWDLLDITLNSMPRENMILRREIMLLFRGKNSILSKIELSRITYDRKLVPSGLVPDKFYLKMGGLGSENSGPFGNFFIFFRTHSPGATAQAHTRRDFGDPLSIENTIIPTGYEVVLFINRKSLPDKYAKSLLSILEAMSSLISMATVNPKFGLSAFKVGTVSAITQVLYPDKNVLQFTEVYFPSDLVLLGKVNPKFI